MAVLGRLLLGSAERLDLPDLLSIDSYTAADFKYLVQSFVGSDKPFVLKGFEIIQPQDVIGTESLSIKVADSVVYYPAAGAGSFYYGLASGTLGTEPLVPELRKNANNFIYLTFTTFDSSRDSRAFWDPDQNGGEGGEFNQDINTQSVLSVQVGVSVSTFPENTIPLAKVKVGPLLIESIQDCRDMMFRLGSGGSSPDPFYSHSFRDLPDNEYARVEPPGTMTSLLDPNPFQGGDKNIHTLKEWMDVVMTRIKEVSGEIYWYTSAVTPSKGPSIKNTWQDALGSTLVSKGEFLHDEQVGGRVIWTEDITYKSLTDPRKSIIRPSTIDLSSDNSVAFIDLIRDVPINTTQTDVTWTKEANYVNGVTGSFENLNKGDWIKKWSDEAPKYLRVEEFYASTDMSGGVTSPILAQSIKLNDIYAGVSEIAPAVYTKGEYRQVDVQVEDRNDPTLYLRGGDFFWLAHRSDVVLGLERITSVELTIDIIEADGQRARVSCLNHGLVDKDRIKITTGTYAGEHQVEVEDENNFFIETTTTGDEIGQTAFYALIETRGRETDDGFELETAPHSVKQNQRVFLENTLTPFDGSYLANPRSDTVIQIPYDADTPDPGQIDGEIVRVVKVNVKTEFGVVKIVQGESVDIGDVDSQNILSYVGMDSLSQIHPVYTTPNGYNALDGMQNFNSSEDDNLTERASKLTSMMADRVQERGFSLRGRVNITSVKNGLYQDISATGVLTLHKPSSPEQEIDLTVSLPANSVAIANLDRDGSDLINLTVESLGNQYLLGENKLLMFYRFDDDTVYTWEDVAIQPSGHHNFGIPEDSANRNVSVFNPGTLQLDPLTDRLYLIVDEGPEHTRISTADAQTVQQSSYFTFNSSNDANQYYVWYSIDANGVDPALPDKTGIKVDLLSVDSAEIVAEKTALEIQTAASLDVDVDYYDSVVEIVNLIPGETSIALNFNTGFLIEVICHGIDPDIELLISGSENKNIIDVDVINSLNSLYLPPKHAAWIRINREQFKTFNTIQTQDLPDIDNAGSIYVTHLDSVPTDQDVFVLWTRVGDTVVESHKSETPSGNIYEEYLDVVDYSPQNSYEILGPVAEGTELILPPDSRDSGRTQQYVVGAGQLEIFLRGQLLRNGVDWEEVGQKGCLSSRIKINHELVVSDSLFWRIDAKGAVFFASDGGAASVSMQSAYEAGRFIDIVSGQPLTISGSTGKLVSILGDMDIQGVIDPKAITFDLQSVSPLLSQHGLWFNNLQEFVIETTSPDTTITNLSGDLIIKAQSGNTIVDSSLNIANTSSSDALVIDQYGTGNPFVVRDQGDPDSTPFVIDSAGNVGIGISTPNRKLEVAGDSSIEGNVDIVGSGYLKLPVGADADQPLSPQLGMIRYNSEHQQFEGFSDAGWVDIGAGATLGFADAFNPGIVNIVDQDFAGIKRFVDGVFIDVDASYSALKITQIGSGNALIVQDELSDSSPLVITSEGEIVAGYTEQTGTSLNLNPKITAVSNRDQSGEGITVFRYSPISGTGADIELIKSASNSVMLNQPVATGDKIGQITWSGADGATYLPVAAISAEVDQVSGINDLPGRMIFSTTEDNAAALSERMRIDSFGNIGIGSSSPQARLHVLKANQGDALIVEAPGGSNANVIFKGDGDQTLRLQNTASTGSTSVSLKMANRLDSDWLWMMRTDTSENGAEDIEIISKSGGTALYANDLGQTGVQTRQPGATLGVMGDALIGDSQSDMNIVLSNWDNLNRPDIQSLFSAGSSSNGGLIQGNKNGHMVFAIRDSQPDDSICFVSGGGDYLSDSTYDTNIMHLRADGKIGINNSNPELSLDVIGDIRVSDSLILGALGVSSANIVEIEKRSNIHPTLDLDFSSLSGIPLALNFERNSTASYYDGKTKTKAEQNLLLYSEEFENNVAWDHINVQVYSDAELSPNNEQSADTVSSTNSTESYIKSTASLSEQTTYTFSFYIKGAGTSVNKNVVVGCYRDGNNVDNQVLLTSEWQRISLTFDILDSQGDNYLYLYLSGNSANLTTGESISIWGAQLEQRPYVCAYIKTEDKAITNYQPTLVMANENLPRIDFNPVTGECRGLLIEEGRENFLPDSEDLSVYSQIRAEIQPNATIAPNGENVASKFVASTDDSTHLIALGIIESGSAGDSYTFSIYAKSEGESAATVGQNIELRFPGAVDGPIGSANTAARFDLENGTITQTAGTSTNLIENVGNGWWRCSITITATQSYAQVGVYLRNHNGAATSFSGNGYSGPYVWGAQIEEGAFPTSYIPTNGSAVTREADNANMIDQNFSDWYSQGEGTIFVEYGKSLNNNVSGRICTIDSAQTAINSISITETNLGQNINFQVIKSSDYQVNLSAARQEINSVAVSYSSNNYAASFNKQIAVSDADGLHPDEAVDRLIIGSSETANSMINGHIRRIIYWPEQLDNNTLKSLTE